MPKPLIRASKSVRNGQIEDSSGIVKTEDRAQRSVAMALSAVNPKPMLQKLINQEVVVRLKWGEEEYKGRLVSTDSYMNIQLANAEEFLEGESKGTLGDVLIRCNNVLWITGANQGTNGDTKMEG